MGFERLNICSLLVSKVTWCWVNVAGNLGLGAKAGKWLLLPPVSSERFVGLGEWEKSKLGFGLKLPGFQVLMLASEH